MKILYDASVTPVYRLLNQVFEGAGIIPRICELGVLRGRNAMSLYNELSPSHMTLIDSWKTGAIISDYQLANAHRPWVDKVGEFSDYYGGSLNEQETFDRLFEEVKEKFKDKSNVEIIRGSTREVFSDIKSKVIGDPWHYIYIDANHAFENVFDDIMFYSELLHFDWGCIQLNDCCFSQEAIKQNIGVLEAATRFCKMRGFAPLLVVNKDFTDVVLARESSPFQKHFNNVIEKSDLSFVNLPSSLFPNLSVLRNGVNKPYLSFI